MSCAIICCAFLAGCASCYGTRVTDEQAKQIQKGVTTKQDITKLFSKPAEVIHQDNGEEIMVYESKSTKRKCFWSGVMITDTKRLTITFDANGVVKNYKIDELSKEELYPGATTNSPPSPTRYQNATGSNSTMQIIKQQNATAAKNAQYHQQRMQSYQQTYKRY
jgi:outer membrane protein assembly factor BamE (lipoprotein component of BamABCDE complex)